MKHDGYQICRISYKKTALNEEKEERKVINFEETAKSAKPDIRLDVEFNIQPYIRIKINIRSRCLSGRISG